jgi:iron complex outermembrane receptor protein
MNTKLSCAIAAILGGISFASPGLAADAGADASADAGANSLEEVIVTAQRRSENMQRVPIAMQAFSEQVLQQLNIATLDDYIQYLPNVTTANNGPGQNEVFMRGLSAGAQASQGSASTGVYPNVAIYLDNQSGQLPNRNLDIYAADLKRIEVLAGPQGTLFGSGAEAGVIRYITNEPELDVTDGSVKVGGGVTSGGDPNGDITGVLNLPLIENKLAARGVLFYDHRGGYIDNVPGTFTRKDTDVGIHYANYATACDVGMPVAGACPANSTPTAYGVPPGSPVLNNSAIVDQNINPVTYKGGRIEVLYKFNDDWDALISEMYQKMDSQGVFYQQPNASDGAALNNLEVTLFNQTRNEDRFNNFALTINGKFGDLKAVYTGGYLERHVEQIGDYTNYARGYYADYYQCYGATACFSPSATWHSAEQNKHMQHEFRLSTPDDWRLRGIFGAYYEDNKLYDQTDWRYRTEPTCAATAVTPCFGTIGTAPGATVENPGLQTDTSSFYQDTNRETKQTAFFVSVDYDLIPKQLTVTLGTRYFKFDNSAAGSVSSSFGCYGVAATPAGCFSAYSYNLNAQQLSDTESGFKSRANVTWHVTPDVMLYYTYSQGFRPGGFNQNGGSQHAYGPDGLPQFANPSSYQSDKLTNNEVGWKTELYNHRLQWNGALYQENWDNVQIAFFNPGVTGNIFFNTNGQNFRIRGIETSLVARVTDGLTLQASGAWNQSEQTNEPALIANVPGSVNYGKAITDVCDSSGQNCNPVGSPFGPKGSPSANAPPIQYNVRARYEWGINGYHAFVQAGVSHTGHSYTQAGSNPTLAQAGLTTSRLRFELEPYTLVEASAGVAKGNWNASLYAENLGNSNASTFTSTDQFIVEETPLRPRTVGVTFGYKF